MDIPAFKSNLLLIVAAVAFNLSGCDGRPTRVPVSGQVLLDGEPLKYGQIIFIPENGRQATGILDVEGKFTLTCIDPNDGTIVGNQNIAILAGETKSPTKVFWHAPKKYSNVSTSGLTRTIAANTDNLLIEITWKNDPPGHPYMEVEAGGDEGEFPRPPRGNSSSSKF